MKKVRPVHGASAAVQVLTAVFFNSVVNSEVLGETAPAAGGAAAPAPSSAETPQEPEELVCERRVYYTWSPQPYPVQMPGQKSAERAPAADPSLGKEVEELADVAREVGKQQDLLRARLDARKSELETEGFEKCRQQHERVSSCIDQAMQRVRGTLPQLDFAARRLVLDGINVQCAKSFGSCVKVRTADIECTAIPADKSAQQAASQAAPAGAAKADAKAEDTKKGAKK